MGFGIIKNNEITAEIIGKYLLTRDNYKKENIKVSILCVFIVYCFE